MDRSADYDDDIFAWSQEQAEVLRRLAGTRRDLPNALDLEHVAEEIGDLGKSELRAARSFVRLVLLHLVKLASAPNAVSAPHWRAEVETFQAEIPDALTRAMEPHVDIDRLWRLALSRAAADLGETGDRLLPDLPARCPLALDELATRAFDLDGAVACLGRERN